MLKKEFKRKDVERARNLIQGKTGDSTETQIGYKKKQVEYKEGDVWTENKKGLSHSKILHGRHDGPKSVVIEPLDNYTMKKRFTHVCLPENWLAKN